MKKILYLIILLLLPINVIYASTIISSDNNKPAVGSIVNLAINIDYGNSRIASSHYLISFDKDCLDLYNFKWEQSQGTYRIEDNNIIIDKENTTPSWEKGKIITLSFRVNKVCTSTINIKDNGESYTDKGTFIRQTYGPVTITSENANDNTYLDLITPIEESFPVTYNRKTNNYNLHVASTKDEIEFKIEANNSKQTIESTAEIIKDTKNDKIYHLKQKLKGGQNIIQIYVTAENGAKNTYVIVVDKEIDENLLSLKRLSVSNTKISLVDNKDTYEAKVPTSIDNITITAVPKNPNVELTGTGTKKIIDGENIFKIKLRSDSGEEKEYTIIITRTDNIEEVQGNTKIKSLKLNGIYVEEIKKKMLLSVDNKINSLNIEVELETNTANYKIEGNNLNDGFNTVIISVFDDNADTSIYNIYVYKERTAIVEVGSLNEIKAIKSNIAYKTSVPSKIEENIVKQFASSEKNLFYQVVDKNKEILYELKIGKDLEETTEINPIIKKEEKEVLTYSSQIRNGIPITLYLDTEEFSNGETIRIYSYEEEGNYITVDTDAKIENGYINFTSNGSPNYIFTKQNLFQEEDNSIKLLNQYKDYIIYGIVVILVIIVILCLSKLSKKKKNK